MRWLMPTGIEFHGQSWAAGVLTMGVYTGTLSPWWCVGIGACMLVWPSIWTLCLTNRDNT